jgi:Nickel responsive protein SCO4226-like
MPMFMDIHRNMKGMSDADFAAAHKKDLAVQGKHGADFVKYWYNAKEGVIFCLCEAPNREAAAAVHREAHGAMPAEVFEVKAGA